MDELSLDALLVLERRGWDALCGSTGGRHYGALMTDDALMVLVDGSVLDRDAVVASLDHAPPWDRYELSDVRVVPAGDTAAVLVYRARAARGDDPPFEAVMASTYVHRGDGVRLVTYQQTTATH